MKPILEKKISDFRRLWQFVRPYKAGLALSVISFVLASLTEPMVPALLQFVLDKGFISSSNIPLWVIPISLIGLFFLRGFFFFCGTYFLNWSTSKIVFDLRKRLVGALIRADASLYTTISPGVAVTKVVNDPQTMAGLLGGALTTLLRDGLSSVAMLGYLF